VQPEPPVEDARPEVPVVSVPHRDATPSAPEATTIGPGATDQDETLEHPVDAAGAPATAAPLSSPVEASSGAAPAQMAPFVPLWHVPRPAEHPADMPLPAPSDTQLSTGDEAPVQEVLQSDERVRSPEPEPAPEPTSEDSDIMETVESALLPRNERIELARAYIELGDHESARQLLGEVAVTGDHASRQMAMRMLREIE